MNRRTFAAGMAAQGALLLTPGVTAAEVRAPEAQPAARLRLSLLHLAPLPGELERNLAAFERALERAAQRQAGLAVAPELALSGFHFPSRIGAAWIGPQPDRWLGAVAAAARRTGVAVLLGAPERDARTHTLHNSAFLFDAGGEMVGRCRKVNVAADGWSVAGADVAPVRWQSLRLGVLICADAYTPGIAARLAGQQAELLISPANWGPGLHGPDGEWEARSRETGLPFIVCNRTGRDEPLDFSGAESLVIVAGDRLMAHRSANAAALTFDWDPVNRRPLSGAFQVDYL